MAKCTNEQIFEAADQKGYENAGLSPKPPHTVVWNDYLLIFSQKCHILFHKKVGNSLQIIKYINLSRFQHILKL